MLTGAISSHHEPWLLRSRPFYESRMSRPRRFRVDHEAITALCSVWWQGEHGEPPPWAGTKPGVLEAPTAERVRMLIKQQRAETPGDMAVLDALPQQEQQSAARAKALSDAEAWIKAQPTHALLNALNAARVSGFATLVSGGSELVPRRHTSGLVLPFAMIKAVLASREHVPNLVERKVKRLASAAQKRGERPPRSRR
jgi:hypothetical protein